MKLYAHTIAHGGMVHHLHFASRAGAEFDMICRGSDGIVTVVNLTGKPAEIIAIIANDPDWLKRQSHVPLPGFAKHPIAGLLRGAE